MSFCYSFPKSSVSFDSWLEKIDEIVNEEGGGDFQETLLSSMIRMSEEDDSPYESKYVVNGSIRGVLVRDSDGEVEILLNTFASKTDQFLAARMAWEAMEMGAQLEKEGYGPIDQEALGGEEIEKTHKEWFSLSRHSAAQSGGTMSMPVYGFLSLTLTPEEAQEEEEVLEQKLIDQLAPYGEAFLSSRMQVGVGGSSDSLIASVVQVDMPSLILKDTQALMFNESLVPTEAFIQIVGDGVLDGRDCWMLPPLSTISPDQQKLIEGQAFESSKAGSQDVGGGPTDAEWDQLAEAPIVAFLIVAAADGSIDKKEATKFSEVLGSLASQDQSPALQQMMMLAAVNFQDILPRLMTADFNPQLQLENFTRIVETRFSEEDAMMLKTSLLVVGHKVAESSGGFLGFGSKISKKEEKALMVLAHFLGIQGD